MIFRYGLGPVSWVTINMPWTLKRYILFPNQAHCRDVGWPKVEKGKREGPHAVAQI